MHHRPNLDVEGLANARDLGGLSRVDGSTTPSGAFYRSEAVDMVTPQGWERLYGFGIRTIIDLRRPSERSGEVPEGIDRIEVDLDGDESEFWAPFEADGRWGTPLYYSAHLAELPHRMSAVLDAVASAAEGAVLFHCAAGWDRTGFVTAMLLRALDVTPDAATADYVQSFANADALARLRGRASDAPARLRTLEMFGHTPTSAFREVYEDIELETWFEAGGVSSHTRSAVRTWRGAVAPSSVAGREKKDGRATRDQTEERP